MQPRRKLVQSLQFLSISGLLTLIIKKKLISKTRYEVCRIRAYKLYIELSYTFRNFKNVHQRWKRLSGLCTERVKHLRINLWLVWMKRMRTHHNISLHTRSRYDWMNARVVWVFWTSSSSSCSNVCWSSCNLLTAGSECNWCLFCTQIPSPPLLDLSSCLRIDLTRYFKT